MVGNEHPGALIIWVMIDHVEELVVACFFKMGKTHTQTKNTALVIKAKKGVLAV